MANTKVKAEQLEAAQTNITSLGTLTALQVDNLNLNGNTISSTDTNGNIVITANGTGNVNVNTDVLAIQGTEGETASLALQADESDDAGDEWRFTTNTNQTLSIQNNISGSGVDHMTFTPHATVASSTVYVPGMVGIGTNSPDVNSFGAGHGILTVQSATGSAKTAMLNLSGDGNDTDATRVASLFFNDASATGAGKSLAGVEAYRASNHATDPGGDLLFSTNASGGSYTERMRIDSTGKVGIGTNSPSSPLHLYEETANTNTYSNVMRLESRSSGTTVAGFGGAIYFLGERNGDGALQGMGRIISLAEVNSGTTLSSGMAFHTATAGTPSEKLRITHDGKVGLGHTSPPNRLTIFGDKDQTSSGVYGANTKWGLLAETANYADGDYVGLIASTTADNNATKPKFGVWGKHAGSGSQLYLSASNNYGTGLNVTWALKENGHFGPLTAGYGLDFSANSQHSGSESEVLDWYEKGTFTPGHTNSVTMQTAVGRYVRVGDLVHFAIQIGNTWSNTTSAWQFTVTNLPFPVFEAHAAGSAFGRYVDDPDNVIAYVTTNEQLHLYRFTTGSWDTLYLSDLNSASAYFYIQGTYRTV